jgi:hypothetical protein
MMADGAAGWRDDTPFISFFDGLLHRILPLQFFQAQLKAGNADRQH